MSVVGQTPCGPSVCYDVDGPLVFILGRCHRSHAPPWHTAHPGFEYFFFIDVVFLFAQNPLHPVPSCYFDLRFKIQYPSSPLNMILWHNFVSCRKEPDLFSKHCAQTLQKKIVMVVTYVFQTSGLKAKKKKKKIYSVSSHVFWSEAWQSKTEIWTMRLLHGDMCLRQP